MGETKEKKALSIEQRKKLLELSKQKPTSTIQKITRKLGENIFPTSFSQRRIWFIQQMQKDTIEYNVPVAYIIYGEFEYVDCKQALDRLVQRHEVLRTTFREVEGEPVQVVHDISEACLSYFDLSPIPDSEEKKQEIDDKVKNVMNAQFDLAMGPLIRFVLVKETEEKHILGIVAHHTIIDSWSIDILKREFDKLYYAVVHKQETDLLPLAIQYGDYAKWQQEKINQEKIEEQITYWVDKLKDKIDNIDLPTDFKRPPIRTGKGAAFSFDFSPELTNKIKQFARENECTVFMVLLAVFQVLLYRYTHKERIVVGSTVASRPTEDTEELIGFFINNLTFNTYIGDEPDLKEYLQRVKKETLENYKYQEVPFEKVVEKLNLKRDLSRTAIFQVMFNYLSASGETMKIGELDSQMYILGGNKASTDLNLFAWEESGFIHLNIEYSTDLFCEATIQRFSQHYENMTKQIVAVENALMSQLEFLTDEENSHILQSEKMLIGSDETVTMPELFELQVSKTPEAKAAYCEGKEVTYQELNEKANQIAHYLINRGIKQGDKIGLYMDRTIEMLAGMLGVMKAGCAYVPLDITYPKERIKSMLDIVEVAYILTQRSHLGGLPNVNEGQVVCVDTLAQKHDLPKENITAKVDHKQAMYILFTSGSTGQPKGVVISHYNYVSYIKSFIERLEIKEPMAFGIVTTFAADLGTSNICAPLLTGGCIHIISYERSTDANQLAAYFKEHPIDMMKMVPSHFEALQVAEHPEWLVPKKVIIFAGEALTHRVVDKVWIYNPECRIFNNYGPTETTVSVLAYEVTKEKDVDIIPLGKPLGNSYVYVLDQNRQPVPIGVEGELYIGGIGVSEGYLGREDLTGERFILDPLSSKDAKNETRRLYRSGDKVRLLASGDIQFLGRLDRQVKIRGYRVELGAIETALLSHEKIKEAAVIAVKNGENNNQLVAYVTLRQIDDLVSTSDLRKYIKKKLADYMVPTVIMTMAQMPITVNGKIDYRALEKREVQIEAGEEYVAPRSELEQELARLWSEILNVNKVGIDDNFFDLGGESFKAIKLTRKIGRELSVIDLFKYPTIRELCERISGSIGQEEGRLVRLTPNNNKKMKMNYICFPFAGGSAITFQPLANEMPKECAVYSVRLPGHDYARPEDVGGTIEDIINECVAEIKEKVSGPISIYAQCVSGALGVALAYALRKEGIEVVTLFEVANFPTPRLPGKLSEWWGKIFPEDRWMSNKVYRETLRSLGNSDDIIDEKEQDFIIAGIRHEARMATDYFSKTYYARDLEKLDIPICCIIGERDRGTEYYEERYHEWERYSEEVTLEVIEKAGHFFHKHQPQELYGIMAEKTLERGRENKHSIAKGEESNLKVIQGGKKEQKSTMSMKIFAFIMLGQIISLLGSNISAYAVGIWLYEKTGSIGDFSLVAVCTLVPNILLSPIAGVVADRYDKRKIMILGDLCAVLGTCFVFIMFSLGKLEVWQLCIAIVVSSIGSTFQSPAFLSAIPILVPKCYLGQANGIVQFVWSSGSMLGPILGAGALFLLEMKGVLLLDFVTCFASVTTLLYVRFPKRSFKKREETFTKELVGGWRYIMKRRSLVVMVVFFIVANTLMSLITVVFTPLAIAVSNESQLGLVLAANATGLVVGSLIISLWGGTKRRADGMVGFLILTAVSMVIMGMRPSPIFVGIGLFMFGLSIAFVDTHWQIMIQSKVGLELQGRVFSINQMLVSIFRPLAMLMAAPICDHLLTPFMEGDSKVSQVFRTMLGNDSTRGMGLLLIITGGILFIWSILGMGYKPLRRMEDYLPDAIPGAVIYEDKDKMQELMDKAIS